MRVTIDGCRRKERTGIDLLWRNEVFLVGTDVQGVAVVFLELRLVDSCQRSDVQPTQELSYHLSLFSIYRSDNLSGQSLPHSFVSTFPRGRQSASMLFAPQFGCLRVHCQSAAYLERTIQYIRTCEGRTQGGILGTHSLSDHRTSRRYRRAAHGAAVGQRRIAYTLAPAGRKSISFILG